MWLDGALCWCYSNSCQSTPEQKYFLLEYQFSQVAWLPHWFAISLSYRQTSFQARWKSVFQSPVGRSHVCLSHHKLSTSWQCFFTCSLASPVSCTGAFGQTETKPCPTANTRFMQVQRGGLSVHKCQAPAPDSICTPIHAPTAESSTNSILLVGNKGRKTLWVTEQGHYPSHTGPAHHLAEDCHETTLPGSTKRAEGKFNCPVSLRSTSPAPSVGQRLSPLAVQWNIKGRPP